MSNEKNKSKLKTFFIALGSIIVGIAIFFFGRNTNRRRISGDSNSLGRIGDGLDEQRNVNNELGKNNSEQRRINGEIRSNNKTIKSSVRRAREILSRAKERSNNKNDD
jgi:hypothetical protein